MSKKIKKIKESKPVKPSWEQSKFAKSIEGQGMLLIKKSVDNNHFIESQVLSWSLIEQILLPGLISFVAKNLKIKIPKNIYKVNIQNIIYFYYCLSHDKDLYENLEKGRKLRNKVVHKLYKEENKKAIMNIAKESTLYNMLVLEAIEKRSMGEVLIPSVNLYRNGWNNALKKAVEIIKEE